MKKFKPILFACLLLLAFTAMFTLVTGRAQAVYYDIFGTNALIKGQADIRGDVSGIGTNAISGFEMLASAKTASYSITYADAGKIITASTTGTKEFDLPSVATIEAGWLVSIANSGGATLTVNPYGTDSTILGLTGHAGDAISNATAGNTVTLVYTAQGWVNKSSYGTWADAG